MGLEEGFATQYVGTPLPVLRGAAFVCGAAVEAAQAIARGRSHYHGYISFCPVSGDPRDLWKRPFSMVAGVASRLSPQMLKGSQRTRAELQSMWQETVGRSFSHAAASFASTGMLRNDTATPIIAVLWKLWKVVFFGKGLLVTFAIWIREKCIDM